MTCFVTETTYHQGLILLMEKVTARSHRSCNRRRPHFRITLPGTGGPGNASSIARGWARRPVTTVRCCASFVTHMDRHGSTVTACRSARAIRRGFRLRIPDR
ncbi:hypothetical protein J2861_005067 [Agrobacterium tumefaciens]|nr:hypothetical protein [Agrobacterium tumefaciens]